MKTGIEETHSNQVKTENIEAGRTFEDEKLQKIYIEKIMPILNELKKTCEETGFPFMFDMCGEVVKTFPAKDGNLDNEELTEYDNSDLFKKHHAGYKIIEQVRDFAYSNSIPYFLTFAVKNTAEATKYATASAVGAFGVQLKNDLITRHQLTSIGARVSPVIGKTNDDDLNEILDRINQLDSEPEADDLDDEASEKAPAFDIDMDHDLDLSQLTKAGRRYAALSGKDKKQ